MRIAHLSIIIATVSILSSCQQENFGLPNNEPTRLNTQEQRQAYALGAQVGHYLAEQNKKFQAHGIKLNKEYIMRGIVEAGNGHSLLTEKDAASLVKALHEMLESTQSNSAKVEGSEYLKENAQRQGVKVTNSGLQYEVIVEGDGAKPNANDRVKVHYHGILPDGTVFDSSIDRRESITFGLNQVIKGWTEGLQLMSVGSRYRFVLPPDLAYGDRASGKIPANSTLIFEVELLDIEQ